MEELQPILDAMLNGVIVLNPRGEVVRHNAQALAVFGLTAEELKARRLEGGRLIAEDGSALTLDDTPSVKALKTRKPQLDLVFGVERPGQPTRWVRANGVPVLLPDGEVSHVVVAVENITEQRRRISELTEYERLFDLTPNLCTVIGLDGSWKRISPGAMRVLGYTPEELMKIPQPQLLHPDDHRRTGAAFFGPKEVVGFMNRLRHKNGDWRTLAWTAVQETSPIWGPVWYAVAADVTERLAAEQRLAQAERLASMGTLAAGIAHEINNPLAWVSANLTVVERELVGPRRLTDSDMMQALKDAHDGASRVSEVVRDLRAFARSNDEKRSRVDLSKVAASALNLAKNEIRHRAQLSTVLPELPPVEANEARLGQVVLNLLLNAAQSIPDGAAQEHSIRVEARSALENGKRWVVLHIRDTGEGIAPDVLPKIFDPFFTTRAEKDGTGLGLFISHGIVTELGGEIRVESTPGKGSTFALWLPEAPKETRSAVVTPPGPQPAARRLKVMVIDDEPLVGRAVARILQPAHEVQAFSRGREALELLQKGEPFDVVLCDVMMPDLSGIDVWGAIPTRYRQAFGFMTGGTFSISTRQMLEQTGVRVLAKPFSIDELNAFITRLSFSSQPET